MRRKPPKVPGLRLVWVNPRPPAASRLDAGLVDTVMRRLFAEPR